MLNSALKIYSELVSLTFEEDGAGQNYSWATYVVPSGYCMVDAILQDSSQLKGKYLGILTSRYDQDTRMVSFYINWRYSGV